MRITSEQLTKHRQWLNAEEGGQRLVLRGADLRGADLRGADLRDADLRDADLRDADLRGADLRDADLRGADLRDADLRGAVLRDADLRGADLRDADLRGAVLSYPDDVPLIENLHSKLLTAVGEAGEHLAMGAWHTCKTTHCRAGHAINLAGDAGYKLEDAVGSATAGALIYHRAYPDQKIPNFYAADKVALADIRACAEREAK